MAYEKVDVVCPCGRLLKTVTGYVGGSSTTTSSAKCPSCKRDVSIQVRGTHAYTSYK